MPPPSQFGGPSRQAFSYDNLYRLTAANGVYRTNPSKTLNPAQGQQRLKPGTIVCCLFIPNR